MSNDDLTMEKLIQRQFSERAALELAYARGGLPRMCALDDAILAEDLAAMPTAGQGHEPVATEPGDWPGCDGVLRIWDSGAAACDCGSVVREPQAS